MIEELRAKDPDWWRGAVIYQIYPRSFQDSNGDGVGDLAGITRRLDYIASLGVDAIWISPFCKSPMEDFGYDVSDYRDIDPLFGTLADFDALIARAHALGLRVMMDLVISHTSEQHPWFVESRSSRSNPRADWYVWSNSKPDGTPPNNWLSIFGGSAWQWDTRREQYYMHNFLTSQPDLNFHNPDVQNELLDITRFWLERGVDGFRLDTLNFYVHDAELRDNPVLPEHLRTDICAPKVNPYNYQEHLYDRNRPENLDFVRRFRAVLDEYGAAAVGEIGDGQIGLELIGEYTKGDDRVQMCYAFDMLSSEHPSAKMVADIMNRVSVAVAEGWTCWAFSNHDCVRHTSRWSLAPVAQRMMVTLMMALRGSACIYQGEELALTEAELTFEDLQDPYGIRFWPEFKGRDGCRTPMVWDSAANINGGFSGSSKTWLPVFSDHLTKAADTQINNPESMYAHYRRAIAFRKAHPALAKGTVSEMIAEGTVLRFTRHYQGIEMLCLFNISDASCEVSVPTVGWTEVGTEVGGASSQGDANVRLGPWQPYFAVRQIKSTAA